MVMPKKKVGLWLEDVAARKLDKMAERYEGNKGDLVAAAILMFVAAEDRRQYDLLKQIAAAPADRMFPQVSGVDVEAVAEEVLPTNSPSRKRKDAGK